MLWCMLCTCYVLDTVHAISLHAVVLLCCCCCVCYLIPSTYVVLLLLYPRSNGIPRSTAIPLIVLYTGMYTHTCCACYHVM